MIVSVRTNDNLAGLLAAGQSGNWRISPAKEVQLTTVRIYNWAGSEVLIGYFGPRPHSYQLLDGKLVIGIVNGMIVPCAVNWPFGQVSRIYIKDVDIQNQGGLRVGIVRGIHIAPTTLAIKKYFERLIKEIKLLGINKIVFRAGGNIPIPDFFREWCRNNGVEIEILGGDELNGMYPQEHNIPF